MDKYYTPEIEEFHVGFEFEVVEDKKWAKRYLTEKEFCQSLNWSYFNRHEERFRVKYLDREDIESLGFKCTGGAMIEGGKSYFEKESYGITLRPNYYKNGSPDAHIYKFRPVELQINTRFSGEVKNKLELKKLLQQLNIE